MRRRNLLFVILLPFLSLTVQAYPYRLVNVASGKALSIADQSSANGALVNQWDWVNVQSQQWTINPIGNGYSNIQNVASSKVITSTVPSVNSDTTQWDWNGWAVQQWRIDPIPNTSFFKIVSYSNNSIVLDMRNADLENNGAATVSTWDESLSQQWESEAINPHQVTQSIHIFLSGQQVWASASADNDYETSYHYVNNIQARMYINGKLIDVSCKGCNQPQRDGSVDAPFIGYGQTDSQTRSVAPGDYVEVEGTVTTFAAYQVYQVMSNCGSICDEWNEPWNFTSTGLFGNGRGVGDPSDVIFTTTVTYYAPAIIVSTIALEQAAMQQSARAATVSPGLRDAFLINYRAFIPYPYVYGANILGYAADGCLAGSIWHQVIYKGDNRQFSPFSGTDRASSRFSVSSYTGQIILGPVNIASRTYRYSEDALQPDGTLQDDGVLHDCHLLDDSAVGEITASTSASGRGGAVSIQMSGAGTNITSLAGASAPSIDWNFNVHIIAGVAPQKSYATLHYHHDCFPAHELYSGSDTIYHYKPKSNNSLYVGGCLGGISPVDGDQSTPTAIH